MAANEGAFGNLQGYAEQFFIWGVLMQVAQAILAPILTPLAQELQKAHPDTVLPPADLVEAFVKGHIDRGKLHDQGAQSGYASDNLDLLAQSAGEPPGLSLLLEMYRRGIIPETSAAEGVSLAQGIRESRLLDKWVASIEAIKYAVLDPGQAVAAALRGNLPFEVAQKLAEQAGVDPADFVVMVHNAGNPPSPGELNELANRGLIPDSGTGPDALTFQQGIAEGDSKNKWWPLLRKLGEYIPPPRTVTAMIREGSLTDEEGLAYFKAAGLPDPLAQAYVRAAHKAGATTQKELTKAEVLAMYADGVLSAADAIKHLQTLGLSEADASELVKLQDVRGTIKLQNQLIGRLRSLYLAGKMSEQEVLHSLQGAGVSAEQQQQLLKTWQLERTTETTHYTAGEIATAYRYHLIDGETAMRALRAIGWDDWSAWLRLADAIHGAPSDIPEPPVPNFAG